MLLLMLTIAGGIIIAHFAILIFNALCNKFPDIFEYLIWIIFVGICLLVFYTINEEFFMEIIVKGFALFKKLIELLKGILILFVVLLQLYGVFVLLKKWIDKIKTKIKKTENNKDLEKVKTVK